MIVLHEDTPRWIRELARFISIKNLIFVYGNVHDLVSFPVCTSAEPDSLRWTESDLRTFFTRFLMGQGYDVVGWADPVEDLSFATREMTEIFSIIESGRDTFPQSRPKPASRDGNSTPTQPTGPCESADPLAGDSGQSHQQRQQSRRDDPPEWGRSISRMTRGLENPRRSCAFVIDLASRLTSMPDRLGRDERLLFTRILKASLQSREVVKEDGRWNNVLILICDKLNDLPTFLYMNNPRSRSISIEPPDREERARFISRYSRHFYGMDQRAEPPKPSVNREFVDFTEGLTHYEMRSLLSLSVKERIPLTDPASGVSNVRRISEMYKYGVTTNEWDQIETEKLRDAEAFIRTRIKGQEAAVTRVLDIVKRAKIGLAAGDSSKSNRPRGVLFFAGPTGVGKTEMAKALAELLFGQEDRLIRFDMSEYSIAQSDQRLLGAPPGYIGYEEGGQLTNAVKRNPFSILLFDEIEKAHGSIFDKFLQILDDGRLTDGKGDTVYFSECVIIFTSNLGAISRSGEQGNKVLVSPMMPYAEMREIILGEIRNHFNFVLGRPEILNRFGDNFVVFDFIKPPTDEQIVHMLVDKLEKQASEKHTLAVAIGSQVRECLVDLARMNLQHGGRGIRNVVDSALVNPLSRALFDMNLQAPARVTVSELTDNGVDAPVRFELKVVADGSSQQ